MKKYYFTFGYGHLTRFGYSGCGYTTIEADSMSEARSTMFSRYDNKWAFGYESLEDIHPIDRLVEVTRSSDGRDVIERHPSARDYKNS